MTPKQKAEELVQRFIEEAYSEDSEGLYTPIAKKASLVASDELLKADWFIPTSQDKLNWDNYWKEVKQEIEKL